MKSVKLKITEQVLENLFEQSDSNTNTAREIASNINSTAVSEHLDFILNQSNKWKYGAVIAEILVSKMGASDIMKNSLCLIHLINSQAQYSIARKAFEKLSNKNISKIKARLDVLFGNTELEVNESMNLILEYIEQRCQYSEPVNRFFRNQK